MYVQNPNMAGQYPGMASSGVMGMPGNVNQPAMVVPDFDEEGYKKHLKKKKKHKEKATRAAYRKRYKDIKVVENYNDTKVYVYMVAMCNVAATMFIILTLFDENILMGQLTGIGFDSAEIHFGIIYLRARVSCEPAFIYDSMCKFFQTWHIFRDKMTITELIGNICNLGPLSPCSNFELYEMMSIFYMIGMGFACFGALLTIPMLVMYFWQKPTRTLRTRSQAIAGMTIGLAVMTAVGWVAGCPTAQQLISEIVGKAVLGADAVSMFTHQATVDGMVGSGGVKLFCAILFMLLGLLLQLCMPIHPNEEDVSEFVEDMLDDLGDQIDDVAAG